jgi:hypothetical protein
MREQNVILVNEKDEEIGVMEKMEAHRKALLHRAFSVFIVAVIHAPVSPSKQLLYADCVKSWASVHHYRTHSSLCIVLHSKTALLNMNSITCSSGTMMALFTLIKMK